MTTELKLWRVLDGEAHSVIAADPDDALKVVIEFGGLVDDSVTTPDEYRAHYHNVSALERTDDYVLNITFDGDGEDGEDLVVTKTAREWIEQNGRGYLGGTIR